MSAAPQPERWQTQLRKGVLELCILNVLAEDRRYGYEIAKRLGDLEGLQVSEGTVYPILSRLRSAGRVRVTIQESAEGPPRKYYELTAAGHRRRQEMNDVWDQLHASLRSLRRRSTP